MNLHISSMYVVREKRFLQVFVGMTHDYKYRLESLDHKAWRDLLIFIEDQIDQTIAE